MNPGELKDRIEVLTLSKSNNIYTWITESTIWGKAKRLNTTNIFSKIGIGAKSVKFTIRKRNISLHNAFRWKGQHCFLTDIVDKDRMCSEITAALIEPVTCTVERTDKPTLDELNRPVYGEAITITFPGYLTEKYIKHTEDEPMSTIETRYVLVTPKVIELTEGELVTIGDMPYEVLISHTLDDFKNEYEISARRNP